MRVLRASFLMLSVTLFVVSLAACKSSGTAYNPPEGTSSYRHMYLSNNGGVGQVFVYTLPITSSSTPSATVSVVSNPRELFVDSKGRLYVPGVSTTTVQVYTLPLTASSTPAFDLTTSHVDPEDTAEDASGNIYVSELSSSGYIDVYDGPVNSSSSPSYSISNNAVGSTGLVYPYGIAFGPNGDLYASDENDINQFTPPFSASTVPSASVTPNQDNYGLLVDSSGRVFVANASVDGSVNVYATPLTNGSMPAFTLTIPQIINGMAFDGLGNLWVVDGSGDVWEFKTPINSSSTATEVLTGAGAYGIVFGP